MSTSQTAIGGTMPTGSETAFSPTKHLRDFWWLLRGELFLLREEWFWDVMQTSFVPLANLLFLWLLIGRRDPAAMTYFVTGSLVMGLSLGGMLSLGQHLGWLKQVHAFDYYATLPISKAVFLFGLVYYPASALPTPLRLIAYLWPTTYAAEALRGAVGGAPAAQVWPPIVVLAGFVALSLVVVPLKLAWRGQR